MLVLIVAKTYMKDSFCVGAYDITNKKNIRLLTQMGDNQPRSTKFDVGQIWNIDYKEKYNIKKPHVEDVLIDESSFVKNIKEIKNFLIDNVPIWEGSPENIFDNKINFPIGRSGFLEKNHSDLAQSVGFWMPDKDLELTILEDKKHFLYFGEQVYSFPYVGYMDKIEKIPKGTLLRVSLTRWWSPHAMTIEKRCYCQLSGWYDLGLNNVKHVEDNLEFDSVF